jgi:hypothetical protein
MQKLMLAAVVMTFASASAWAGKHTYQVTGPIVEVNDNSIVVKKGSDNWEVARDASTKVTGDLAVGTKVTIEYTMTATSIEAKPAKGKKK